MEEQKEKEHPNVHPPTKVVKVVFERTGLQTLIAAMGKANAEVLILQPYG